MPNIPSPNLASRGPNAACSPDVMALIGRRVVPPTAQGLGGRLAAGVGPAASVNGGAPTVESRGIADRMGADYAKMKGG